MISRIIHTVNYEILITLYKDPGGVHVKASGFLDIPVFIDSVRKRIQENGKYSHSLFLEDNLKLNGKSIQYGEITSEKIG